PGGQVGGQDGIVLGRRDAGVVERDVDTAEGVLGQLEQRVHFVRGGDVGPQIRPAQFCGDIGAADVVDVADDDLRSLGREAPGGGQAEAGATAGDHGDLVSKTTRHDVLQYL